jgi:phosphoserine phosphatase
MLAVVDVDRTLLKENISFLFGKELFRRRYISRFQGLIAFLAWCFFRMHWLSQEKLHSVLFRLIFCGRNRDFLEEQFRLFFQEHKKTLVRYTLLETIRARFGSHIALFSSSPDFMIKEIGRVLGIQETHGSQYCVDRQGRFSSLGTILTGENKASLVQMTSKPLAVYTDSADDLPLLERADFPVAVCPDRRLLRFAQKKGWDILYDHSDLSD